MLRVQLPVCACVYVSSPAGMYLHLHEHSCASASGLRWAGPHRSCMCVCACTRVFLRKKYSSRRLCSRQLKFEPCCENLRLVWFECHVTNDLSRIRRPVSYDTTCFSVIACICVCCCTHICVCLQQCRSKFMACRWSSAAQMFDDHMHNI